jgi:hypothetical protein
MKKLTQTNLKCSKAWPLFTKAFILFAILAFTSLGYQAKGQVTYISMDNTATSGCDWNISIYDAASNLLTASFTAVAGAAPTTICNSFGGTAVDHIVVDDGVIFCTVNFIISPGSTNYTAYTPPCAGLTCATNIDCQEGVVAPAGCSTASTTIAITIN